MFRMVQLCNGSIFVGSYLHWWQYDEMVFRKYGKMVKLQKHSMVKWIVWWHLTVSFVVNFYLVSLNFVKHSNNSDPDDYGAGNLCYLWLLLDSLFFFPVTFMSSLMVNCCNVDVITDGVAIMVKIFLWVLFFNWLLLDWILNHIYCPGHVPGDISWENFPEHCFAWDNSQDAKFPGVFPGLLYYFFTWNDIYLVSLYAKLCVRYSMFPCILHSTF